MNKKEREIYTGKINISFPWDLPEHLTGPSVMFDVVSASQNIIHLTTNAKELYVVNTDTVYQAIKLLPKAVLIGESPDPQLQNKFICTNSSRMVANTDVSGKQVILITDNGTHTLYELSAKGAQPIITANYANLHTVSNWLLAKYQSAEYITLVPSGGREKVFAAHPNLIEDLECAKAMQELLEGKTPDLPSHFEKSLNGIHAYYPADNTPNEENIKTRILTPVDTYPIVPICRKQQNNLLKIIAYS